MTKPAFTCDLGYGVEHFSDLQQISDRQLNDITPRTGSTAWYRRIARRGGDLLGAPITRDGVLVARVSYNGRLWEARDCVSVEDGHAQARAQLAARGITLLTVSQ